MGIECLIGGNFLVRTATSNYRKRFLLGNVFAERYNREKVDYIVVRGGSILWAGWPALELIHVYITSYGI